MKSPFKFLDSFTKDDREIFFGREKEIEELYQRIFRSKIMLVYGVSGTGKSSLINCGLANKFRDEDWLPLNVRRGKNILESMYSSIVAASLTPKSQFSPTETQFRKYVKSLYLDYYKPIYFIFDQFEELFIFGNKEEKSLFVRVIKTLVESDIQCRFIFVMREEYMANVTEFERHIPVFFSNRVRIENMDINNAKQAIIGPCKVFDISVEEGFPEALIENLSPGSPDIELTYLQVFLDKVFHMSMEGKEPGEEGKPEISFTLEQLGKVGNVSDLLGTFLNDQISLMVDPDSALAVLKSFVSVKGTKRQMNLDDVKEYAQTLGKPISEQVLLSMLQNFVNLRILRDKDQHERYELRHDSLATKIYEKISGVEKDIMEIRQFIEDGFHNWQKRGILLSSSDLEYIAPYESRLFLSAELLNYISHSKNQLEKVKRKRMAIFVSATFVLLILFAGLTVWALLERSNSKKQEIFANANYYNALSKELVMTDPTKALRIAEYACKLDPSENNYQNLVNIYSGNEFYFSYLPTKSFNITDFRVLRKSGNIAILENTRFRIINSEGKAINDPKFLLPKNSRYDISPDGKYFLIYTADTLKVFDNSSNLIDIKSLKDVVNDYACFTLDSKILITAYDITSHFKIYLWSINGTINETNESFQDGSIIKTLSSDSVYFLRNPNVLYCWVPEENKILTRNLNISSQDYIHVAQFISKDKIALLTEYDTIRIFSNEGSKLVSWYAGDDENRGFNQIYFLNKLNLLCGYNGKIIKFWDTNGQNITNLKIRGSSFNFQFNHFTGELLFLMNGKISYFTPVDMNNKLVLKKENKNIQYNTEGINFMEYSRSDNRRKIISTSNKELDIKDAVFQDDKYYYIIPGSSRIFTKFPTKYSYKSINEILIYDIFSGKEVVQLNGLEYYPINIYSSDNGSLYAAVGKRVYNESTNSWFLKPAIKIFNNKGFPIYDSSTGSETALFGAVKFTKNKKVLYLASSEKSLILQDSTGKVESRFVGHLGYIQDFDISFDDNYILTAAYDKTVRLWSRDGKLIKVIQLNETNFRLSFLTGELAFQILESNSCKLYNINGILMQKIPTKDLVIYNPNGRLIRYITDDGIHQSKLKQPVDSFIVSNNHNDLALNEKIEYGILTPNEIMKSKKPEDFYWGGRYFLDNLGKKTDVRERISGIKTAEELFKKGLTFDTLHGPIARRLTELYIQKYQLMKGNLIKKIDDCFQIMTESNKLDDLVNALNYYGTITIKGNLDTIKIAYGYVEKVISLGNKLLDLYPNDRTVMADISQSCSNLSFYLLDFKQYKNSLTAVKTAIKADSTYQLSYTNLPLAFLFNNMYENAEQEYIKWKDKPWTYDNTAKTFAEVFLTDIADLEGRGITHPDFAKVKELLKK